MTRSALFACALLLLTIPMGCDPGSPGARRRDAGPGGGGDSGGPLLPDADGDGIPDQYEGRSSNVDTDGDGTPDYLDDDSDGDGLPDMIEGGRPNGEPLDSDGDGTYDFRDFDSDGNGILDATEGSADPDGDGAPNSRDLDNDGDLVTDIDEIGPDPSMPINTDGDTLPDFLDPDSDNDFISDHDEGIVDTDMDMTRDRADLDSDQDGINDADEAGDTDINTAPIDTDLDATPDFRDADSDNDGLSDAAEHTAGSSPVLADTDGDGVTDLVEVASMTNPTDPADSPRSHGDFVFLEPYGMPADPPRDTLDFATNIRVADVYFLIDTTGSMGGAISSVQSSLSSPGGIIDQVHTTIADAWFGVGDFKDAGDVYVYQHRTDITADASAAQTGVNGLFASGGGDYPEGDVPALYATATGNDTADGRSRTGCPPDTFGYPCFRNAAVPIIVLITDAPFHNGISGTDSGYTDYATMRTAITNAHIRVIGVAVGTGGQADLEAIARDSGAVDGSGAPLVTVTSSGSVDSTVVTQIQTLASATRLDISVQYQDDTTDAVDSFAAFVSYIEANQAGDATRGCAALPAVDTNGDGHPDTFQDVTAGTRVCFDIVVKQNDTVMPTTEPQLFRATLNVIGDGFTPLDNRDVFFLVPPVIPPPGGPG